jgi:hypothetical protein
MKDRKIRM